MKLQALILAAALSLAGCAGDPLRSTVQSCDAARAAVEATDAAVLAGKLKKADAQKALVGLAAMKAGCDAAVASLKGAQ